MSEIREMRKKKERKKDRKSHSNRRTGINLMKYLPTHRPIFAASSSPPSPSILTTTSTPPTHSPTHPLSHALKLPSPTISHHFPSHHPDPIRSDPIRTDGTAHTYPLTSVCLGERKERKKEGKKEKRTKDKKNC